MLFKTRAGLSVVTGSFEVYAHQFETSGTCWLYAHLRSRTEGESNSFFKKVRFGGSWIKLVGFKIHAGLDAEIGSAMHIVAEALKNSASICDLSQLGSAEIWDKKLKLVRW
jgi:hypothetical protein